MQKDKRQEQMQHHQEEGHLSSKLSKCARHFNVNKGKQCLIKIKGVVYNNQP